MEISVLNITGEETGRKVAFSDKLLDKPNDHCIYLDVKQYLANQRQGTHKTKERGEIKGSTKKLRKQKGGGSARVGSIKSPIFRGGGTIFGPSVRNHSFKLNKKTKSLARKSALSYRFQDENVIVVEDVKFEQPKTQQYLTFLKSLKLQDVKTLFVLPKEDKNVILSSRNIKNTKVTVPRLLNTYDIINADRLLVCESAVEMFNDIIK